MLVQDEGPSVHRKWGWLAQTLPVCMQVLHRQSSTQHCTGLTAHKCHSISEFLSKRSKMNKPLSVIQPNLCPNFTCIVICDCVAHLKANLAYSATGNYCGSPVQWWPEIQERLMGTLQALPWNFVSWLKIRFSSIEKMNTVRRKQ